MAQLYAIHRIPLKEGRAVEVRARFATTTGEHLAWILALCHADEQMLYAQDYLSPFVESVLLIADGESKPYSLKAIAAEAPNVLLEICEAVANKRTLPDGFSTHYTRWWSVIHRADKYDPDKAEMPCDCPHCKNREKQTDACLFWGIDVAAQLVGSHDWELANECWDKPVEVYQLLLTQRRQRTLGVAASRQEREAEDAERAKAAEINSKASWASAGMKRQQALDARRRALAKMAMEQGAPDGD